MTRVSLASGLLAAAFAVLPRIAAADPVMTPTVGPPDPLSIASFDPDMATAPITAVQGPGVLIGEGTTLHPTGGVETGYISNVLYDHKNVVGAGVLRALGQFGFGTATSRLNPAAGGTGDEGPAARENVDVQYSVTGRISYDKLLSDDPVASQAGGLGLGLTAGVMTTPGDRTSFALGEDFTRLIRAANFETTVDDNRDVNNLTAMFIYRSPGAFSGYAYLHDTIDVFESDPNYPSRMENVLGVHPMWRWLPQTLVYGDFSIGEISGIGTSQASTAKPTSLPLNLFLGIASLITLKTTAKLEAGYANGFYSSGPSYSSPYVNAAVSYRYSPLGLAGLTYRYSDTDSVNANYFRDHLIGAFIEHGVAPFVVVGQAQLHFREYSGLEFEGMPLPGQTTRDDYIVDLVAGIRYNFRNWLAASLDYRFSTVQTYFRYVDMDGNRVNPSYFRHELMLGVRAAL